MTRERKRRNREKDDGNEGKKREEKEITSLLDLVFCQRQLFLEVSDKKKIFILFSDSVSVNFNSRILLTEMISNAIQIQIKTEEKKKNDQRFHSDFSKIYISPSHYSPRYFPHIYALLLSLFMEQ